MKKGYWILIIAVIFIILFLMILRFGIGGDEDSWIKDNKGIWIEHGNPSKVPVEVLVQQEAIDCAFEKFNSFSEEINSQCLGVCGNYVVDIVHVPRNAEDDKSENQCEDYANGLVSNFIELDQDGQIVRIV